MDFFINFLWYLLAFVVGAVVAWLVAAAFIKDRSADDAFRDVAEAAKKGITK